jgi:hypothetical protein
MNEIEKKIILGNITALEVGLQGGNIPLALLRRDAERLLQLPGLPPDLCTRLVNLRASAVDDEEESE